MTGKGKLPEGIRRHRRPGTWEVMVRAGRDPDSPPGKPRYRTRSRIVEGSLADAKRARAELVSEVSRGVASGTLAGLFARWLDSCRNRGLATTTLVEYERITRAWCAELGEDRPLGKVSTFDLEAAYRRWHKAGLSAASIERRHSAIRSAMRRAESWQLIPTGTSPVPAAERPSVRQHRPAELDPDDINRLIGAAEHLGDWEMATVIAVTVRTGLRRGEVSGLRWSRVDLRGGTITVDQAIADPRGKLEAKPPKTHQVRKVVVGPGCVEILAAHRARKASICDEAGVPRQLDGFVFTGPRDPAGRRPLRPDQITRRWCRIRDHAGVDPRARFHDLRHAAATLALAGGANVVDVAAQLGHANSSTTLRVYSHAVEHGRRAAAAHIETALDTKGSTRKR